MKNKKSLLLFFLKILVGIGLIVWLVAKGNLDFSFVGKILKDPIRLTLASLAHLFVLFLLFFRLKLLLFSKKISLTFWRAISLGFVGQFFSTVLPGAVTGDVFKAFYIKKDYPALSKKFLFFILLVDRLLGLTALFLIAASSSLFFYSDILEKYPVLLPMVKIFLGIGGSLLFLFFVYLLMPSNLKWHSSFLNKLWEVLKFKKIIFQTILISCVIQGSAIWIFWYLLFPMSEGTLTLELAYLFAPIGFLSTVLPISPAGLGVGHTVFETLFTFVKIPHGASLYNVYFLFGVFWNLTGFFFYLTYKDSSPSDGQLHPPLFE